MNVENPNHNTPEPTSPQEAPKAKKNKSTKKIKKPRTKGQKIFLVIIILVVIGLLIGLGIMVYFIIRKEEIAKQEPVDFADPIYSLLTGEEIADASLNSSPTYCVQIPNGGDGRPQAGLTHAAVVFEAIAESGITRFAAIFQNSNTSAIGPIRSLRPYYLEWDLPFDCTIVHAGGSDEAVAELHSSGARDMNENLSYMWRETGTDRNWNNLFTSAPKLNEFNTDHGYTSSSPKTFPRLTPDEVSQIIDLNNQCPEGEVCDIAPTQPIKLNFGASQSYNLVYNYDPETNTYFRSYASGDQHLVYDCPADLTEPNTKTQCGSLVQVHPSVVIAMVVRESRMDDGYHENIVTTGTGNATIFQNGEVIEGTWQKTSTTAQLIFRDSTGNEIKLTPGQVWISAIPQYGSISY